MSKAFCPSMLRQSPVLSVDSERRYVANGNADNLSQRTLRDLQRLVEENADEFRAAWKKHLRK